ncbi:MAG TPA: hypothetical protein VFJ98_04475 [Mycobacteriales bacterium]|nr:hypothetical protein [Mycobacteriales bacterium]
MARLSRASKLARGAAAAAVLVALAGGSAWGQDPWFPVGPMVQYAKWIPPDGVVRSTTVWADTTDGRHVQVRLDPQGVGVRRADVEEQLPRILAHPELLRTISSAQRRLHPHDPQFVRLYVVQDVIHLHDRVPTSRTSHTLVTWDVTR